MKAVLASSGCAAVLASEEDDEAVVVPGSSGRYVAVFDPLDGSRNIDAAIPTGECSGCGWCQAGARLVLLQLLKYPAGWRPQPWCQAGAAG
jgi:fructose-1,6-bisphosphatase